MLILISIYEKRLEHFSLFETNEIILQANSGITNNEEKITTIDNNIYLDRNYNIKNRTELNKNAGGKFQEIRFSSNQVDQNCKNNFNRLLYQNKQYNQIEKETKHNISSNESFNILENNISIIRDNRGETTNANQENLGNDKKRIINS